MGKLVRDRIPDIIRGKDRTPVTRVLDDDEAYRAALFDKLIEEAQELREAERRSVLEELADVYEVVLAIAAHERRGISDVAQRAQAKRDERGGFTERVYLESW